jgi:hypothetical protein
MSKVGERVREGGSRYSGTEVGLRPTSTPFRETCTNLRRTDRLFAQQTREPQATDISLTLTVCEVDVEQNKTISRENIWVILNLRFIF